MVLRAEAIESLLSGDLATAGKRQGLDIPEEFLETINDEFLKIQLERSVKRPSGRGWCVRIVTLAEAETVIGHSGFHGHPDDVGRAEIGYLIFERFRGNGYATETTLGLVNWAHEQGVEKVFVSISPENPASIRVAERAGFHVSANQLSDSDNDELLYERATRERSSDIHKED